MYFHFKSKDQIALAVMQEQQVRSSSLIADVLAAYPSAIDRLIHVSRGLAGQVIDDPVVRAGIRLALEENRLGGPVAGYFEDWITDTQNVLEPALLSGELVSTIDAAALARTIVGFSIGVQVVSHATTEHQDLLQALVGQWRVLVDAIVPAPSRAHAVAEIDAAFRLPQAASK